MNHALKTFRHRFDQDAVIEAAAGTMRWERARVAKTTRITIETESLLVVYRGRTFAARCPACCAEVEAMTLTGDGLGEGISPALLGDWLRTGKLHLWRPAESPAQICLPSLLQCFESKDVRRLQTPVRTPQKTGDGK